MAWWLRCLRAHLLHAAWLACWVCCLFVSPVWSDVRSQPIELLLSAAFHGSNPFTVKMGKKGKPKSWSLSSEESTDSPRQPAKKKTRFSAHLFERIAMDDLQDKVANLSLAGAGGSSGSGGQQQDEQWNLQVDQQRWHWHGWVDNTWADNGHWVSRQCVHCGDTHWCWQ